MIKTVNEEYKKKNKELLKLKVKMLKLFNSVDIRSLTETDQNLLETLIDDSELVGEEYEAMYSLVWLKRMRVLLS